MWCGGMFADIEADIYVLVDGDDTYDASASPQMITRMIADGADLLTGRRIHTEPGAYRPGHVMGNRMLTGLTAILFNVHLSDMLSGYRVFFAPLRQILSLHGGRIPPSRRS
jgi:hypothetical protein